MQHVKEISAATIYIVKPKKCTKLRLVLKSSMAARALKNELNRAGAKIRFHVAFHLEEISQYSDVGSFCKASHSGKYLRKYYNAK